MIHRKEGISLVSFTILVLLMLPVMPSIMENSLSLSQVKKHDLSYIEHEPFNITSNQDFFIQGWPGNGSSSNPYIIENLNITSNSTCIWIQNTTSYFAIQNCVLSSDSNEYAPQLLAAVTLTNVTNGQIQNNLFLNCKRAISFANGTNSVISNNELQAYDIGIICQNINQTTIMNNTQLDHGIGYAINMVLCNDCLISENKFGNVTFFGIDLAFCTRCNLTDNIVNATTTEWYLAWSGVEIYNGYDCRIISNRIRNFIHGISVVAGMNNSVSGNILTENDRGAHIESNYCIVQENTFFENSLALELIGCNFSSFVNNELQGRSHLMYSGFLIHGGSDSNITLNHCTEVDVGFAVQGANRFLIEDNVVDESRYGIMYLWSGWYGYLGTIPDGPMTDCDILNNTFNNGGFYPTIENVDSWNFDTINFENNKVHGQMIGFFHDLTGISISGESYGQIILVRCNTLNLTGGEFSNIHSDALVYLDYLSEGEAVAVSLIDCHECIISEILFYDNTIGIALQQSSLCQLLHIEGYDNSWTGAIMWHCEDMIIRDCNFYDNKKGIGFGWTWNSSIIDSILSDNDEAINLANAPNCSVSNNQILGNGYGIFLGDSDQCVINGNLISLNGRGILLNSSSDCILRNNYIGNSTGAGIAIDTTSHRNTIYNNTFAYNSPNAMCTGSSNHWDDQISLGNRWSDYGGEGPYIIDEDDQDNYPSIYPPPVVEGWTLDPLLIIAPISFMGIVLVIVYINRRRQIRVID